MKQVKFIFTFILFIFLFFGSFAYSQEITKIIAKVNNRAITSKDLDDFCEVFKFKLPDQERDISCSNKEFMKKALEKLIEDNLVLDEAKNEDLEIPYSLIENRLRQITSSYSSRDEFEESLKEKGLNITLLKNKIKEQHLMRQIIEKYVKAFISVSPAQISAYYAENSDKFISVTRFIFYVAKSTDSMFLEKISKLIKNEGITQALAEYEDFLIKVEAYENRLNDQIFGILMELENGKHRIENIDEQFHLIYLEEIVPSGYHPLEKVKEQIYSYLWEQEFSKRFREWVEELKSKAVIKNYYE